MLRVGLRLGEQEQGGTVPGREHGSSITVQADRGRCAQRDGQGSVPRVHQESCVQEVHPGMNPYSSYVCSTVAAVLTQRT